MCIVIGLNADEQPLFGKVSNIAKSDTLNVRSSSTYKSKRLASLPFGAFIGIKRCEKVGKSKWCEVYPLTQYEYENFTSQDNERWVNARYLKLSNKGYVTILNKRNCDYALMCKDSLCEIVSDYTSDKEGNIIDIKTKWVKREYLKAESSFGAASSTMDGYCNNGMFIDDYLEKNSNYFGVLQN